MVAVEDAEVDVVEVAVAAEDAVVDVTDPVRTAVMTAVIVTGPVRTAAMIAVRTAVMDLVLAVAPVDPGAEVAVEARRNSAWTRRPSPLWVRLPLKVRSSSLLTPGLLMTLICFRSRKARNSKLLLFHPERILIIDPISWTLPRRT